MSTSGLVVAVVGAMLCVGCGESFSPAGPSALSSGASLRDTAGGALLPRTSRGAHAVPFKGTFEGSQTVTPLQPPLIQVDGHATGTATRLGRFTVQFPHTVNFALAEGTGTYTFVAANGDTLTARFTGRAQVGPVTSIVEEAVITGGTGRFEGASGSFTAHRLFDPATGVTTGSFEGAISTPGAGG